MSKKRNKGGPTSRVSVSEIIEYEDGSLGPNETLDLFSKLIKNGMAWTLQGSYGRTAKNLIESGYLSDSGDVLSYEPGL